MTKVRLISALTSYLIIKQFFQKEKIIPGYQIILFGFYIGIGIVSLSIGFSIFKFGKDGIYSWDSLWALATMRNKG